MSEAGGQVPHKSLVEESEPSDPDREDAFTQDGTAYRAAGEAVNELDASEALQLPEEGLFPGLWTNDTAQDSREDRLRDALAYAQTLRAELSPSAAGMLRHLEHQLDEDARSLLRGPQRCLLVLREAQDAAEWSTPANAALEVLLQTFALPSAEPHNRAWTIVNASAENTTRKGLLQGTDLGVIATGFTRHRVVAVRSKPDDVHHHDLVDLADLTLSIEGFDGVSLAAALRHGIEATAPADDPHDSDRVDSRGQTCTAAADDGDDATHMAAARRLAAYGFSRLTPDLVDLACRRAETVAEAEEILSRALSGRELRRRCNGEACGPTLESLPGYGAVRAWAQQLVDDISAYRAGRMAFGDIDPGALLAGPPGTGKTLLASSIAASAGCSYISTSFAAWQSADDGHLGSVVKAMRAVFANARQEAPAVLFIDELDSIPARGRSRTHDEYWRAIVNALLEELDGTSRREGLVVLAACNDPDLVDPAIVRSGRLDRVVHLAMPSADDLEAIIRYTIPEIKEPGVARVAAVLAGKTTGADITRIAREVKRRARTEHRAIEAADLIAVAFPPDTRSPTLLRRVAIHEAGHAVAMLLAGRMPQLVSIQAPSAGLGGVVMAPQADDDEGRLDDIEQLRIVPILCGRASEEVLVGTVSAGAGGLDISDLAQATGLAASVDGRLGLGGWLSYRDRADGDAVEGRMRRLYAEALLLVLQHRHSIERLAVRLIAERVLTSERIQTFALEEGLGSVAARAKRGPSP